MNRLKIPHLILDAVIFFKAGLSFMDNENWQKQREIRIKKLFKYLKIDDQDHRDYDLYSLLSDENNIFEISKIIVDKQHDIFLKTGKLMSFSEIINKAIIRGLDKYK